MSVHDVVGELEKLRRVGASGELDGGRHIFCPAHDQSRSSHPRRSLVDSSSPHKGLSGGSTGMRPESLRQSVQLRSSYAGTSASSAQHLLTPRYQPSVSNTDAATLAQAQVGSAACAVSAAACTLHACNLHAGMPSEPHPDPRPHGLLGIRCCALHAAVHRAC
jgi:hypothetical protein